MLPPEERMSAEDPKTSPAGAGPKAPGRLRRILVWTARLVAAGLVLGLAATFSIYWYYARDLPGFETLADYRPLQTTRLVTAEGEPVGELFLERRTVVPLDAMPALLPKAFIAAEDERFYDHEGLDYVGIVRALVRNVQAGGVREGASTITQQVVKTFLLSPERRYSRKFREMILARRLEQNLTKDEILYLYLNQIYFGHGRHGVQEAARYYFDKDVGDLDLAEIATLAALPRAPNLYSPRRNLHRARGRRGYVLRRMVDAGFLDAALAEEAAEAPLEVVPLPPARPGAWYVEEVRRLLEPRLGSDVLLGGGLVIEVAMDPSAQAGAEAALGRTLRDIDKRQGWRGALTRLDGIARAAVTQRYDELVAFRAGRGLEGPWAFDLVDVVGWQQDDEAPPPVRLVVPEPERVVAGIVTAVADRAATVDLGGVVARLTLQEMRWARPFSPEEQTAAPRRVGEVLSEGDVVLVRLGEAAEAEAEGRPVLAATLEQHPLVEGALVAVDPETRGVVALVGGYDMARSHFNRATQARRQPGSAFKPFVYGAALETGRYTAATPVLDAPEIFRDPWTGDVWRPQNVDGRFDGDIPLRASLARSKNVVSVRMTDDMGVDAVIDFATRAGIRSRMPRFLPLALGSGEVTPLELTNAYATLAAGGVRDEPVLVFSVRDAEGRTLFEHVPAPEQTMSPEVAYVLTDLLTAVLTEGTGRSLDRLDRPAAGKTGTTDDRRDAWFVGYTAELVAGAWVGFDEPQPLGRAEYGGRAAGPAWLGLMEAALEGRPKRPFEIPPKVQFVRIDPKSGLLALPGRPGRVEPFLPDTAPTRDATSDVLSPVDLLLAEPGGMP
jgi:penicillin-binding protein 1A